MARHLVIIALVVALFAAQLCPAQPLQVPQSCPMKTRCCRMLPAQPADAIRPQVLSVALAAAQPLILTAAPSLPLEGAEHAAPFRDVPTRTVVLRI